MYSQGAYTINPIVYAIIPARKGSKRLPKKNKKLLLGKPLIEYTIDEALKSKYITWVLVSTDDEDIIDLITNNNEIGYIHRPEELAKDDTEQWEVITHALKCYKQNTIIILLQPTSPLRTVQNIDNALEMFFTYNKSVLSIYKKDEVTYKRNGAIFIDTLKNIRSNKGFKEELFYIMPKERSIDIDYLEEFKECEEYLKNKQKKEET